MGLPAPTDMTGGAGGFLYKEDPVLNTGSVCMKKAQPVQLSFMSSIFFPLFLMRLR